MDLTKPSTSADTSLSYSAIDANAIGQSEFIMDSCNLDPLYLEDEDADQEIVFKFLEGELNFDYRERVAAVAAEGEDFEQEDDEEEIDTTFIKQENDDSPAQKSSPRKKGHRKGRTKLPTALKGLMGEANVRCARGDKETAVKLCLEIIRHVPTAAEPFQTLAGIYEETGEREKGLQMAVVAAHLSSTDVAGWVTLSEQSEELGNIRQAITCLTKAINLDIKNMDLHRRRANLLEQIGDRKTAVRGYMRLLYSLDTDTSADYIVSVARLVAELCHKGGDYERANEALELAVLRVPSLISYDFVNLHLELLILMKSYRRCLEIMVAFCDLVVEAEAGIDEVGTETFVVIDITIPDTTPVDILSKLGIVLIHMDAHLLVERVLAPLLAVDVAEVGELYLDVAEAWAEVGSHEGAVRLYEALVASEAFSLPGVWLKLGDSLEALGRLSEAAEAYRAVLAGAEGHAPVRLRLVRLLQCLGRLPEALDLLPSVSEDPALLYARANLLASSENPDPHELVNAALALFARHSIQVTSPHQVSAISGFTRTDRRRATVCGMQGGRPAPPPAVTQPDGPAPEEEWKILLAACQGAYRARMYATLYSLTATAQLSLVLASGSHRAELDILSAIAAHLAGDHFSAYNYLRHVVLKNIDNPKVWTLFNIMAQRWVDGRLHRFVMRLAGRHPEHPFLGLLHGNNCLVSGTYKYALHEYYNARTRPLDPALVRLLISLTYLQIAAQKFTGHKHSVAAQAIGLLSEYRKLRSGNGSAGEQEAHYNFGRALQHLGIFNVAAAEYIKAIECAPSPLASKDPEIFDLTKEAAFNLHLIYLSSGNHELAAHYINMIEV